MTVGYHAPPPGSHSGVADYAETLKGALRRFGTVTDSSKNADINLYHLGNNKLHAQIYAAALKTPGVIVLHDAVLHHFMLGALSHEQYIAEWIYNYGSAYDLLGELTDQGRITTGALGGRLRRLYVDQLGFLPRTLDDEGVLYCRFGVLSGLLIV